MFLNKEEKRLRELDLKEFHSNISRWKRKYKDSKYKLSLQIDSIVKQLNVK